MLLSLWRKSSLLKSGGYISASLLISFMTPNPLKHYAPHRGGFSVCPHRGDLENDIVGIGDENYIAALVLA
jgi:hypothetical protein